MSVINSTELISEFGAKYTGDGPALTDLIRKIAQDTPTSRFFRTIRTDKSHVRNVGENIQAQVQAYQKAFTPAGEAEFFPEEHPVYPVKIDVLVDPDHLWQSYIGNLAQRGINPADMPITKFIVDEMVADGKVALENNAYWGGVYANPTAGTAGVTSASMDGLGVQITSAIEDEIITPISTVAITSEDTAEQAVKSFILGLGKHVSAIDYIFMSAMNAQLFSWKVDRNHQAAEWKQGDLQPLFVKYGNKMIVGLPSMGTSDRIWATPERNRVQLMNLNIRRLMQPNDRTVKVMIDWAESLRFGTKRHLFANDKA